MQRRRERSYRTDMDATEDAGQPAGDLVQRAIEVVDARLERDGEVDEIPRAPAEQHALRRAGRVELQQRPGSEDGCGGGTCGGADRDPGGDGGRDVHEAILASPPSGPNGLRISRG